MKKKEDDSLFAPLAYVDDLEWAGNLLAPLISVKALWFINEALPAVGNYAHFGEPPSFEVLFLPQMLQPLDLPKLLSHLISQPQNLPMMHNETQTAKKNVFRVKTSHLTFETGNLCGLESCFEPLGHILRLISLQLTQISAT